MLFFVYAPATTSPDSFLLKLAELSCNCTFKISSMTESITENSNTALIYFFGYQIAIYLLLGWGLAVAVLPSKKTDRPTKSSTEITPVQD